MHIIQNFLGTALNQELLEFTIANESNFVPSTTSSNEANYRSSLVLYDLKEWRSIFEQKLSAVLPAVFESIEIDPFIPSQIEMQLTSHGDGNFYKWHSDNGSHDVSDRVLTYVYYFWHEPKMFRGGHLEFEHEEFAPINDGIVFFPSSWQHQVTPVQLSSDIPLFRRHSINGWIRC
jgi:SM-20-related protein